VGSYGDVAGRSAGRAAEQAPILGVPIGRVPMAAADAGLRDAGGRDHAHLRQPRTFEAFVDRLAQGLELPARQERPRGALARGHRVTDRAHHAPRSSQTTWAPWRSACSTTWLAATATWCLAMRRCRRSRTVGCAPRRARSLRARSNAACTRMSASPLAAKPGASSRVASGVVTTAL